VELSDDEEPPVIPPPILNVGVELNEFELLRNVVFDLRTSLSDLQDSTITN
jgi:hypothetical protein